MKDAQEAVDITARDAGNLISANDAAAAHEPADRIFLLECRLDQLYSALQSARADADDCRTRLAASAAREVDHALRAAEVHAELAAARQEVVALHRRLEHTEALRAETDGRLLESGARDEAGELARLRREVRRERRRADAGERTLSGLRARIEELIASRETLLTRVAEWQSVVRQGDPEAIDLSEFIAALRGDILDLEHRNAAALQREAELREQLDRAGVAESESGRATPEATEDTPRDAGHDHAQDTSSGDVAKDDPSDGETAALAEAGDVERQLELLRRLGRSRDESAFHAIRRWATAPEPRVRAAAFEALGHLLGDDPARLEPHLRWGLADGDARVRRRVVLAAAAARGVALRPLLEPLRLDPDAQVRRVIQEVLRRAASPAAEGAYRIAKAGVADEALVAGTQPRAAGP